MPTSEPSLTALLADPRATRRNLALADARQGLAAFCELMLNDFLLPSRGEGFRLAAHHHLWIRQLERIERGEITRLMGFMPPGAAKSTYAVDLFTPWFMGRAPDRSVILATYGSDLARRRGRKARAIARGETFAAVFDATLAAGAAASDEWALDNGSDWMGGGILSGMTGNRADLLVIDDPVKGREEADSPAIRARTREEFDDSLRTRLKPGGRIVLIQTRWHEDDLAGQLLPEDYAGQSGPVLCRDGEVWEVVNIPAQAERADDPLGRQPGQMLWPEHWPDSHWTAFRNNPRTWSALYQQRPKPDAGSYFERSGFRRFRDAPATLRYYATSDYAVTDGGGDYTALRVWGVDADHDLWLVGGWRGRTASDVWIEQQIDLIARFRPLGGIRCWYGEAGVIQRAVEPMLRRRMQDRREPCALRWLPSIADKAARARSAQSLVRQGKVHIREGGDGDGFIEECVAFPAGRWDDDVDNLSLIGRAVDRMAAPVKGRRAEVADMGEVFGAR